MEYERNLGTLFGRSYRLFIGDSEESFVIDNLNVQFSVSKDMNNKDNKNSSTVGVFNLDPSKVGISGRTRYLSLEAGYQKLGLSLLTRGTVVSINTRRVGGDVLTEFHVEESFEELNKSLFSRIVPEGRSVRDVIEALVQEVGVVSRAEYTGVNVDRVVIDGYPITGSFHTVMGELSSSFDLDYSVDNDVLYVTDKGLPTKPRNQFVLLSRDSGMEGTPVLEMIEDEEYVRVIGRLNPALQIGSPVKVEDREFSGIYRIKSIQHEGEYMGAHWQSQLQLERLL